MLDVLDNIKTWFNQGYAIALGTLIKIEGSSSRELGATIAINELGEIAGSISGGCVESAIVEEAMLLLENRQSKLLSYGAADELNFEVGLTCGGTITVFLEFLENNNNIQEIIKKIEQRENFIVCTNIQGLQQNKIIIKENFHKIIDNHLVKEILDQEIKKLSNQNINIIKYYQINEIKFFLQYFTKPLDLIIFGAMDFTKALCQLGKYLGYQVTVCDPRSPFATKERFPDADNIILEWPHLYLKKATIDPETVIIVLTHDPKFDVPALMMAIETPANYIGVMGSRKTHQDRLHRLKEAGITEEQLTRISSPLGLDIGGVTPQETAISIMAEVIALKHDKNGGRLSQTDQPIHSKKNKDF